MQCLAQIFINLAHILMNPWFWKAI